MAVVEMSARQLNAVELSVLSTCATDGIKHITLETVKSLTQMSAAKYDREGDEHYDLLSAFQKSMRGSDPNAAVHYLGRLLEAGDLPSVCRRLIVCACEDVGLAYPMIIPIVKAAVDSALQVGLPEARIPLADAVILVCSAPKSNSAYMAINSAMEDIRAGKRVLFQDSCRISIMTEQTQRLRGSFIITHTILRIIGLNNNICQMR